MKAVFFIILIAANVLASNAKDWKVVQKKGEFFLEFPQRRTFSIQSAGGTPKHVKTENYGKNFLRVVYHAGSAGTSRPVEVYRAILFKKKPLKYLGDFPYAYSSKQEKGPKLEQPVWSLEGEKITVKDPSTDFEAVVGKAKK